MAPSSSPHSDVQCKLWDLMFKSCTAFKYRRDLNEFLNWHKHPGAVPAQKKSGGKEIKLMPKGIPNNFYVIFAKE